MSKRRDIPDARCRDCGMDTMPTPVRPGTHEQFIVHDHVWKAAGMPAGKINPITHVLVGGGGCLCVCCIESRLGRRLTIQDFKPITFWLLDQRWVTERLKSRFRNPLDVAWSKAFGRHRYEFTENGLEAFVEFENESETRLPHVVGGP
jgi:hypothetical protein